MASFAPRLDVAGALEHQPAAVLHVDQIATFLSVIDQKLAEHRMCMAAVDAYFKGLA